MPLIFQQNINANTKVGLWDISEDEYFFSNLVLSNTDITHPLKRLQTMAGRNLLIELFPDLPLSLVEIAPTKKPFIPGDPYHFSISHCKNFAAAIVSRTA
ncbi:MAG: 4-phosphopantetheinyl transferase, partial [Ferruginibacter sp.]